METQRNILIIAFVAVSFVLYQRWVTFQQQYQIDNPIQQPVQESVVGDVPDITAVREPQLDSGVPETPESVSIAEPVSDSDIQQISTGRNLISVTTDLVRAKIDPRGGSLVYLELIDQPESVDQPDVGYKLLKNPGVAGTRDLFVARSGLLGREGVYPNHNTEYQFGRDEYHLDNDELRIPLTWQDQRGVVYTKEFVFRRDSYLVELNFGINNGSADALTVYPYAQWSRTENSESKQGGFGQLPSYLGGVFYTDEDKYQKIDFGEMEEEDLELETGNGWVAMIEHYFVAAWLPERGEQKELYTSVSSTNGRPVYNIGYKSLEATRVAVGQTGMVATLLFAGPKEQIRLRAIEDSLGHEGLNLTVDYGWLTFIADPLFWLLEKMHLLVGNWGWAIILLTLFVKILFYPLSAASYKSMAAMKKLQPRMQTLKERYADDKQKFQTAMMELYKQEKVNPAGGCLPILIQMPVFIALYWVLLESVELRQADFALWWNDLSSPDPYYVLPILMGASMFLMQKLNPAPMDPTQQKVMMIMPVVLTFLFLGFPQGLVLYWVVNNILSMGQQWLINKRAGAV